jgi:hypothetical protein
VPVEKQAGRPFGRADRRFLLVLGLMALGAIVAGAVYAATHAGSASTGPCFTAHLQSTMGGVTVHRCGSDAVHYCRVDARAPEIAEACREAGFTVGRAVS